MHWVTTGKRPDTRDRRLLQLIDDSAAGRTVPPPTRRTGRAGPTATDTGEAATR